MEINYFLLLPIIIVLDLLLGEPKYWHPLVGFGWLTDKVEMLFRKAETPLKNHSKTNTPNTNKWTTIFLGVLAWCLLIIPFIYISFFLEDYFGWWFSILLGYLAIGAKSLKDHALQVADALKQGDLTLARTKVSYIVSRDTSQLDEQAISRSSIESVLENGSDAIFSALFWFLVAGASGVVLYRLSNTLDAMWGYRNEKYEYFGKFSARVDDILNWIPARLTALSYLLMGNRSKAWQCWRQQASQWYSPNAGVVMATGAGALDIQLGGIARYHGKDKTRPILGTKQAPQTKDIYHAWNLVFKSIVLWTILSLIIGLLLF